MVEEKVVGSVSPTELALNWRWHPPRDTPPDVRRRLIEEERRAAIVERWPTLPQPALHGKTPQEAAGDPQLRIPLMASRADPGAGQQLPIATRNRSPNCGASLTCRNPSRFEPRWPIHERAAARARAAIEDGSRVRRRSWCNLYRRAILVGAQAALLRLAREAVRRPSLADRIPPADAYQRMIAAERDPERALALIDDARECSASGRRIDGQLGPGRIGTAHHAAATSTRPRRCWPESNAITATTRRWRRALPVAVRNRRHSRSSCRRMRTAHEAEPADGRGRRRRAGRQPHLDARQRSAGRRQIGSLDAVLAGGEIIQRDTPRERRRPVTWLWRWRWRCSGLGAVEPNPMVGCVIVRDGADRRRGLSRTIRRAACRSERTRRGRRPGGRRHGLRHAGAVLPSGQDAALHAGAGARPVWSAS